MGWREFEVDATNFLNEHFNKYATFTRIGESNSTISDIRVNTKSGKDFFIEAKGAVAQSGQFVVNANPLLKCFFYSNANATPENRYSKLIIEHMNNNFDKFESPGTSGVDIEMLNGENIFFNWIISMYKSKEVRFFISESFILIPLEKLPDFFFVSAKYRVKKSGSSNVGKSNINAAKKIITDYYNITNFRENESKLFVTSDYNLNGECFNIDNNVFMLSERQAEYEVRKLSNTFNANIIFSIKLKTNTHGISHDEFIHQLL